LKDYIHIKKVPLLFGILCFSLISLMVFQFSWLTVSKQLIEEQFDQKVNLAIGSALSDYNANHQTELDIDDLEGCNGDDTYKFMPTEKGALSRANQLELEESLSQYMSCYGIDEKYSVEIFDNACQSNNNAYCCSINTAASCNKDYQIGVSFLSKEEYLADKLWFFKLSSILIFILLTSVSFIILNALIKQKKITDNNIDFFSNTAHELKTPLTNISLALSLLTNNHSDLKNNKYARIIKSENGKLTSQIEKVLYLSRMENGEYQLNREGINLKDLVSEVQENLQMILAEKNGHISIIAPQHDIEISGDYFHLSNAFKNIIDNAIKYCDKEPRIIISIIDLEDHVKLVFQDNGIGIKSENKNHIFEKFQRVNTGDVRDAKGFGIGLAYVKTVVGMHKGLIRVKSDLNKGSQFELIIPNI